MRIGIVGHGFVGQAISNSHTYYDKNCEIIISDPKLGPQSASLKQIKTCDLIYVCVPSPSLPDGSCDTSILESVVRELADATVPVVCKTTAPPAVYEVLETVCPQLLHSPEFLTAANHKEDYLMARFHVVGGKTEVIAAAVPLMFAGRSWQYYDIISTDVKSAALYKYMMNCYLATKVTFMNEFFGVAQNLGVSWDEMKLLMRFDERIGNTHVDVPGPDGKRGWGGACFPKDVMAMISHAKVLGCDMPMLSSMNSVNAQQRNH